jgi:NADPH2:quinone reductase
MRAYAVSEAGAQPGHHDLEIPEPAPGEVRVRVRAASVNGFDLAVAAGYMSGFFEHRYPVVLGREFAGVVDALGEGVDNVAVGDRVFGVVSKPYLAEGAFAEYTTADAGNSIAGSPPAFTDDEAAGLGHTGSTALIILGALGPTEGRTVLIVGATGGVGTLLTQLLAAEGAKVIATGRTEEGRALLTELGAAHTVDYANLEAAVRAIAPNGVDAAVHLAGDPEQIARLIKDGGIMASALLYAPELFPDIGRITPLPIAGYPTSEGLHRLADLADERRLRVIIDRDHDFNEIDTAFARFGHETLGNIIVRIG